MSGQSDLHGRLLSVREMLFYLSYVLVCPSTPSGTLTMLRLASPFVGLFFIDLWCYTRESDGRCVRASGPVSVGRSIFYLLLNPPSYPCFSGIIRLICYVSKCSPFLPLAYATPRPDVLGFTNIAYFGSFTG